MASYALTNLFAQLLNGLPALLATPLQSVTLGTSVDSKKDTSVQLVEALWQALRESERGRDNNLPLLWRRLAAKDIMWRQIYETKLQESVTRSSDQHAENVLELLAALAVAGGDLHALQAGTIVCNNCCSSVPLLSEYV